MGLWNYRLQCYRWICSYYVLVYYNSRLCHLSNNWRWLNRPFFRRHLLHSRLPNILHNLVQFHLDFRYLSIQICLLLHGKIIMHNTQRRILVFTKVPNFIIILPNKIFMILPDLLYRRAEDRHILFYGHLDLYLFGSRRRNSLTGELLVHLLVKSDLSWVYCFWYDLGIHVHGFFYHLVVVVSVFFINQILILSLRLIIPMKPIQLINLTPNSLFFS